MPRQRTDKKGGTIPILGLSAVGNRSLRFREAEGLISWEKRKGSDAVNAFMINRLPPGAHDQNTTIGGSSLTKAELGALHALKSSGGTQEGHGEDSEEDGAFPPKRAPSTEGNGKGKEREKVVKKAMTPSRLTQPATKKP